MSGYRYVGFSIRFLNFCSETRTAAADGSIKQVSSRSYPDMVLVAPPLHLCTSVSGLLGCRPLEVPDLFDQVSLFVIELFIFCSVILKLAEKLDEFSLVFQQDVQDGLCLVRIGHKHLVVWGKKTIYMCKYLALCLILFISYVFDTI